MVMLRKRPQRSVWQDWRNDHRLWQAAFGLFLTALAVWLVALYRGVLLVD